MVLGPPLMGKVGKPNSYVYLLQWEASHYSVWASSNWKGSEANKDIARCIGKMPWFFLNWKIREAAQYCLA